MAEWLDLAVHGRSRCHQVAFGARAADALDAADAADAAGAADAADAADAASAGDSSDVHFGGYHDPSGHPLTTPDVNGTSYNHDGYRFHVSGGTGEGQPAPSR